MKKILFLIVGVLLSAGIQAQGLAGSWTGKLNLGGASLSIVFHFTEGTDGKWTCAMDSPDQGAKGIPAEVVSADPAALKVEVKALRVVYEGALTEGEIKGKFTQNGFAIPLNLKPGTVKRNRPQTPQPPYPYQTEEVSFSNDSAHAVLAGTLVWPVGNKAGKPVPVVLMVTGSGPQNRDEELFQHKPFLVIADYLARHGIATLRYDDRGWAKSTGDVSQATTEDFMKDAAAGISWLRSQKKFSRVGVLGHSEGGTIAFMLAAAGKADFIVSLAGSAVKGDTISAEQNNMLLKQKNLPGHVTTADVRRMLASSPQDNAWTRFFIDYDPAPAIAAARCPVMAVNGTKDMQVMPELNFSVIKSRLPKNKKNFLKLYDGLNHLFQHCTTGYADEYPEIEETFSPEVLADIAGWINKL